LESADVIGEKSREEKELLLLRLDGSLGVVT
jgi:hypothetical protein